MNAQNTQHSGLITRLVGTEPGWAVLESSQRVPGVAALVACTLLAVGGLALVFLTGGVQSLRDVILVGASPLLVILGIVPFVDSRTTAQVARGQAHAVHAEIDFKEARSRRSTRCSAPDGRGR